MTRKKDNRLCFRFSDDVAEKLDTILDAKNSLLEKMGASKMTKTYFLEKLIHDEYINYLNKDKDPETTERIDQRIDARLELAIRNRDKILKEILFENRKTNAMLKLLLGKQNINIHNTEVVESIENKSELEIVIDRLIGKKVFGDSENKIEKVKPKQNASVEEFEEPSDSEIEESHYEHMSKFVDEDGLINGEFTPEEYKMLFSNYHED